MRPSALSALVLLAAVGCGVPDNSALIARADALSSGPKGEAKKPDEKKPDQKPAPDVKPVETDPKKLGIGIVDSSVGTGETAAAGDTCYMLYTGKLKNDPTKVFDSTAKRENEPFAFQLGSGQVIKGWDLGIVGMKVGGKRTLTIPAEYAYGSEAKGDDIPANSDLVFDIELVGLLKPEDADTVQRETITPGTGPAAKDGDVVSFKYKGTTLSGKVFDDNGGKPVQVKLGPDTTLAVPGLEIAIKGMKKGQRVIATVPPALGLPPTPPGPSGPPKVAPNSIVKFDITLVSIG